MLGGSNSATTEDRWTMEGSNETAWNANGRRHRFKALVWGRADGLRQEGASNALGGYTFSSWPISPRGARRATRARSSNPSGRRGVERRGGVRAHVRAVALLQRDVRRAARGRRLRERARRRTPTLETALGVRTGAAPARAAREPAPRLHVHIQSRPRQRQRDEPESRRAILSPAGGDAARRDRRVPRSAAARHPGRCVGRHRTVERHAQPLVRRRRGATARLVELRRGRDRPRECLVRRRRALRACAIGDADRSGLRRATQLAVVARVDHRAFGRW